MVLAADSREIKNIVRAAKMTDLTVVDFPRQALTIWTDQELVKDIAQSHDEALEYLGVALYGNPETISRLTSNLKLWR